MVHYETDVLIVGGGLAGITAALELLESNKKILILDRDEPENFGGQAKRSAGAIIFFGTPIQRLHRIPDSIALGLDDWFRRAEFTEDDIWPKRWAELYVNESVNSVYHWLLERSIKFISACLWVERGALKPLNSVPRCHMVRGGGATLIKKLIEHLQQHPHYHNLSIKFQHAVHGFEISKHEITQCQGYIEPSGTPFTVKADAVILAAGGMAGGDLSYLRENWYAPWGPPPPVILRGAHRYADGLLHREAKKWDIGVTHLDRQWHYPVGLHQVDSKDPNEGFNLLPSPSAYWINALGQRIGPPPLIGYSDHAYQVEQICKQPGQFSWQILNWKIAIKEIFVSGYKFSGGFSGTSQLAFLLNLLMGRKKLVRSLIDNCIDVVVADTLAELVAKMNALEKNYQVDLNTLASGLKAYDAQIDRGQRFFTDAQLQQIASYRHYGFERLRICKFQKILDHKAGPFIAIRSFILARKSMGGIQTDLDCRVLDKYGQAISGLYAIGEMAGCGGGGMHGMGSLEGTYLGACILNGRIASKHIINR